MSYFYRHGATPLTPGQRKLLGIILKLHEERRPISFRLLAKLYGCALNNITQYLRLLRNKGFVTWEDEDGVTNCTIRPLVKFIPADELGETA